MPSIKFYHPVSVDEAVSLLTTKEGSRCVAGGQTLVAMMNAQLVEVPALISVASIQELKKINTNDDGSVRIGAAVCHRDVASYTGFVGHNAVIQQAARTIAHPAIRNFGTMGGALAHADPAADYPTATVAAGALVEIANTNGRRIVPAEDFFVDYFTTALLPGELVTALILVPTSADAFGHYLKFSRVDGDYAIVSVGVTLTVKNGLCSKARLAIGGCASVPVFSDEANKALIATGCEDAAIDVAAAYLSNKADPIDDVRASADYRRALIPKLLHRAIKTAIQSRPSGVRT
jgi:carbon-monoxide dehydrogenase medium subunit